MDIVVGFGLSVLLIVGYWIWEITVTDFHYIIKSLMIIAIAISLILSCVLLYDYINTPDASVYRKYYRAIGQ